MLSITADRSLLSRFWQGVSPHQQGQRDLSVCWLQLSLESVVTCSLADKQPQHGLLDSSRGKVLRIL